MLILAVAASAILSAWRHFHVQNAILAGGVAAIVNAVGVDVLFAKVKVLIVPSTMLKVPWLPEVPPEMVKLPAAVVPMAKLPLTCRTGRFVLAPTDTALAPIEPGLLTFNVPASRSSRTEVVFAGEGQLAEPILVRLPPPLRTPA